MAVKNVVKSAGNKKVAKNASKVKEVKTNKRKKLEAADITQPTESAKIKKKLKVEATKPVAEDALEKIKPVTKKTKSAKAKSIKDSNKAEEAFTESTNKVTVKEVDKPVTEKAKKKTLKKKNAVSLPVAKTTKKMVVAKAKKKKVIAKKVTKGAVTVKAGKKSAKTEKVAKPQVKPKELVYGSGIQRKMVEQALEGVRKLEGQRRSNAGNTKDIFEDDEEDTIVYLQVGMLKIAQLLPRFKHVVRPVKMKIYLPHSVVSSNSNVLLITKDAEDGKDIRADHTENLYHYQYLLRKCGAAQHISEVITLRQLKVEFKEYEAKRHLSNRSDVVLCDDTILFRLPKFLGKHFYGKRKFPIPVNLKSNNLLKEVEQCLRAQILWLPMKGDSGLMKIGRLDQSNEEIMENIQTVVERMQEKFPGGWGNIKVLHLKTEKTKSVPFYLNLNSPNSVQRIYPKPINSRNTIFGEVSTDYGSTYCVYPDNNIEFVRRRKRQTERNARRSRENTFESFNERYNEKYPSHPEEKSREEEPMLEAQAEPPSVKPKTMKSKKKASNQETDTSSEKPKAVGDIQDDEMIDFDEFEIPDLDDELDTKVKKRRKGANKEENTSDKKATKGKKKKKEEELDLDLDFDDDGELNKIEREYLRSLREEQANKDDSNNVPDDEYDDWAEDSDEDIEDFDLEM